MSRPGDEPPDETLASLAQQGDQVAFDTLVRRHKLPLYHFVRRYIGQSDDAYDVLQDTFIAVWRALRRYDRTRPFLPWLRTIALNKCRDFSRRQGVRRLLTRALAIEDPPDKKTDPFELETQNDAQEAERLQRLDQAIAGLPAIYKEPLLLTTVAGLSQKEAAALLKISVKALEMRLYRARQKLAETVQDT